MSVTDKWTTFRAEIDAEIPTVMTFEDVQSNLRKRWDPEFRKTLKGSTKRKNQTKKP